MLKPEATDNAIKLDAKQKELLGEMQNIAAVIKPSTCFEKVKRLLFDSKQKEGIYLHGGVGRGKTMLMKMFYSAVISRKKEIIHFQKFMQNIHKKLHLLQGKTTDQVLQNLANDIAQKSTVICMDEFEIKDIADAMIIMSLFRYLLKNKVFIFLTTNTLPDNLYKDGMQRESFLPFIEMIKSKFRIMYLDSQIDYRYNALVSIENKILYPASSKTDALIKKIEQELGEEEQLVPVTIESFGRNLVFSKGHKTALATDFAELFERPIGYADYVALTERFKIIIVKRVRDIRESETDILTRFINFIDNAYFNKVVLFMEIESSPESIYSAGDKKPEFNRTVSRLTEMNSNRYL